MQLHPLVALGVLFLGLAASALAQASGDAFRLEQRMSQTEYLPLLHRLLELGETVARKKARVDEVSRAARSCCAGWATLLITLAVLLPVPATAMEDLKTGPFSEVPVTHWAYDCASLMAQYGIFTGYPDGTFAGKRTLTRYEFAVALQRMVQEIARDCREGMGLSRQLRVPLNKLTQEFSPELAMLGTDLGVLRQNVRAATSPWLGDAPDLAACSPSIYPGVGTPEDPEYRRGARLAAEEWTRGEAVFYVAPASRGPRISASTGMLYRAIDTRSDEPGRLALIAGHNAEVRHRLHRYGPPASAHPGWVETVLHVERPWTSGTPPLRLNAAAQEAASSDGTLLLRIEAQRPGMAPLLRVTTPERVQTLSLAGFDFARDTLEARGTSGNELLHLAVRRPQAAQARVYVVELQGGAILNQGTLPSTALQAPPAGRVQIVYPFVDGSK